MQTYCLVCRKSTDNLGSKKVEMTVTGEVIQDKSRCVDCMSNKSRFLKQKSNKKSSRNKY